MKIRGRAWVIAVVAGFAVEALLSLVSNVISYFVVGGGAGLRGTPGLPIGGSLVSTATCACLLVLDLGVGLLYSWLATREGALPAGEGALGGGLAGSTVGLLSGVLGVVVTAVLLPTLAPAFSNIPQRFADEAMFGAILGGILGGVFGVCIAILRGALLAAVGGAIGASIFKSGSAAPGPTGNP